MRHRVRYRRMRGCSENRLFMGHGFSRRSIDPMRKRPDVTALDVSPSVKIRIPHIYRWIGFAGVVVFLALGAWISMVWHRARLIAPSPTLYLQDRHGQFLGETGANKEDEYGFWSLEALPPRVVAATLAVEDRRFNRHPGIDPLAVGRAILQNFRAGKRISGASTLAMQIARLQNPGRRGYSRKAMESLTALFLTWRYGREAVLRHYLQIVPYGNRIHGISYAARRYFDKPVEDLSWAEIAFLAAIPQAPARMNPFYVQGYEAAAQRGKRILDLLLAGRYLSKEEYALACNQLQSINIPYWGERPRDALHAILHLGTMLNDPQIRMMRNRRPIVKTTLDLDLQKKIAWMTFQALKTWKHEGAGNGAAIILDRDTNEVLAWVGSSDYFDAAHAGAIDYTSVPRSPGSTLKPFIYALAMDRGTITPATILDDVQRGAGGITNADAMFLGPLLPRMALANSRNVPAANLLQQLGVESSYDFLRDLGLHNGARPAQQYGLGLAIGGMPATLEQLVRAYTVFSQEGRLGDLIWYDGQPHAESHRLLTEETARIITLFLSDPLARLPGFARMGSMEYPFPAAVKTGTSSRFRDAWTVAFTTRYVIGVWIGDPDFQPMNHVTGYRSAAELAQQVLLSLHQDEIQGLTDFGFPPPRGCHPVRLCALSGLLATHACDRVVEEWFRPGSAPVEYCRTHVRLTIDRRDNLPATPLTPAEFTEVRSFVDLPSQYAEWAAATGLPRLPQPRESMSMIGTEASAQTIHVTITTPENGLRLLRDPETPANNSTLALKALVSPQVPQIVWYVDRKPFQLVEYPYSARWIALPGEHIFQARVPNSTVASAPIRVVVQ
jgi:penicillin-binding protein 1C